MASADLYIFTLSNTRYIVRNVTLEMKCEDNIKSHLANAGLVQAADQYDLIFGAIKWHNDDTFVSLSKSLSFDFLTNCFILFA